MDGYARLVVSARFLEADNVDPIAIFRHDEKGPCNFHLVAEIYLPLVAVYLYGDGIDTGVVFEILRIKPCDPAVAVKHPVAFA